MAISIDIAMEKVTLLDDGATIQDISGIMNVEYRMKARLREARCTLKHLESIKTNVESGHLQNFQVVTSSDVFISTEMKKLNGLILLLEEVTTKLQNILKS